ncbi:DUF2642 domain-containing protein [Paenibacillus sp. 481]|uniref:DUF2642 domain-containing protein n=1 Tax=Paenibacillus sp. 481 TaxID=2835869 RepID=UPI001E35DBBA|nr:DUF2642 domain-containing protein [Paenibacillus sp. 481]UHA74259.1 DUF2642 domain-containing protein [Paenibacillus sp. 481]
MTNYTRNNFSGYNVGNVGGSNTAYPANVGGANVAYPTNVGGANVGYPTPGPSPCHHTKPIVQPIIQPIIHYPKPPRPPIPTTNVTFVRPCLIEHLYKHEGCPIVVVTKCGELKGTLCGVFVDHLELSAGGKKLHVLYDHICYVVT